MLFYMIERYEPLFWGKWKTYLTHSYLAFILNTLTIMVFLRAQWCFIDTTGFNLSTC